MEKRFHKPTLRQKLAVDNLIANGGNVTEAMRKAGYSKTSLNSPTILTKSLGFKKLCDEAGLNPGLLVHALVADIKSKPGKRVGELRLGADMLGLTKHEGNSPIVAVQVNLNEDRDKYGS